MRTFLYPHITRKLQYKIVHELGKSLEFQSPYNEEVAMKGGDFLPAPFLFQSPYNEEVAILIGI